MDKNILEIINDNLNTFSKTHKKIALYILKNFDSVIFLTSMKLAKFSDTSESSVIRFANVLGYDGYTAFQKDLQNFVKEKITLSQRVHSLTSNEMNEIETLNLVVDKSLNDIKWIKNNLDQENYTKAIKLLSKARRIYLIGSRTSFCVTYFMFIGLSWIRDDVFLINHQGRDFDKLSQIGEYDVVLSVSLPRYLKSTINLHKYGYSKGANTICITDTYTSPLVKYSTVPLIINSEILSFSDNLIPVMCIATGLLNSIAKISADKSEEKMKDFEAFWIKMELYETF